MADLAAPAPISGIDDGEKIRVLLLASGQPVHAPLIKAVEAGAHGRLIPKGGETGDVLTKASATDFDVVWQHNTRIHSWINFDGTGTPPTIRDSENIASITDNGTGDYTLNFSASIGAGAAVTVTVGHNASPAPYFANLVEITTQSVRFQVFDASGTAADVDTVCVHIIGTVANWLILSGDEQDSGLDKVELSGDEQPGVELLSPQEL